MNEVDFITKDDAIGETTLEVIEKAQHFNRWMYQTIRPFCSGNILENGSGIGNNVFLPVGTKITTKIGEKTKGGRTVLGIV